MNTSNLLSQTQYIFANLTLADNKGNVALAGSIAFMIFILNSICEIKIYLVIVLVMNALAMMFAFLTLLPRMSNSEEYLSESVIVQVAKTQTLTICSRFCFILFSILEIGKIVLSIFYTPKGEKVIVSFHT